MNNGDRRGDLLVLVADLDMERAVKGLLARPESLEMAPVQFVAGLHEVTLALILDRRVFAEIQENITWCLNIQSHIGVHSGALAPRQRALM